MDNTKSLYEKIRFKKINLILNCGGKMKSIIYIFLAIIFSFCLIYFSGRIGNNKVFAASTNSASDLQLMARAINRRSKRRIL